MPTNIRLNLYDIIALSNINITKDQLQKKFGSVWQKMHVKHNSEITVG